MDSILILSLLIVSVVAQPLPVPQGQYPVPNSNPAPVLPSLQAQYPTPQLPQPLSPQYLVANPVPASQPCNTGCPQNGTTSAGYYMASDGNYYYNTGSDQASTTAAPTEEKTKGPPNRFNDAGWETDDNGNLS